MNNSSQESTTGSGGDGGIGGIQVGNFVKKTRATESQNWGGVAYLEGKGFDPISKPNNFKFLYLNVYI